MKKETVNIITKKLLEAYPDARCALDHKSVFELLIATILSAQCTDKRVNIVTQKLFACADTPQEILALGEKKLHSMIQTCGLANAKTKNILNCCAKLVSLYGGEVPHTREELMKLDGVGRKTANVVLSVGFHEEAIAVDTHVHRLANRIGFAQTKDPLKTEQALMETLEKGTWSAMHHALIWHGRNVCHARNPECTICVIRGYCETAKNAPKQKEQEV